MVSCDTQTKAKVSSLYYFFSRDSCNSGQYQLLAQTCLKLSC